MHFRNIFSTTSKGPVAKNSEDQVPIPPMSSAVIGGLSSSAPTGDSIPTTADARNNASIFQRFRLAQETPVPFHPGFRTNEEEEEKLPQPLGVTRKPGGKWDYIDERFGKIYTEENQEYAALISPGQWKRRDSHKLVWVKVGGGEFVVKEEEAKNSLLEGVTSRKGNDLEWINVSDDRFVVREKEDNCSERSNGTEEKKNNEPENPENNDECHML
jgi:hypothetical protein